MPAPLLHRSWLVLALGVLLLDCSPELGSGGEEAAPARPVASLGDAAAGQAAFGRCLACHSIRKGGGHTTGPNLFGVVGRQAGSAPGYVYSVPMARAGFTWSEDTLMTWIAAPAQMVPGTVMNFQGVGDPIRRNIVAYMATLK